MNYIVMDLEWNQPVNIHKRIKTPCLLYGEIIQIGAVKLNEDFETVDEFNELVAPTFYKKVLKGVEKLTGITDEMLKGKRTFPEVVETFRNWCGEDCAILTWGPNDMSILNSNYCVHSIEPVWQPEVFDAQLMFDETEMMEGRDYSLDYAVYHFGIKGNKAHDALNDARDTAEVVKRLDAEEWIEEERRYRDEQELEEEDAVVSV